MAGKVSFSIRHEYRSQMVAVVTCTGNISEEERNTQDFKEGVWKPLEERSEAPSLVVNFDGVPYIDSVCLGILIGVLRKLREKGRNVVIVTSVAKIKKIFNITGLIKIFNIFKTEQEALDHLKAMEAYRSAPAAEQ